jgi:hypothetical protein
MTEQHNTLLVGGRGQAREGRGPNAFDGIPHNRLNGMRIADMRLGPNLFYVVGDAAAAYEAAGKQLRGNRVAVTSQPVEQARFITVLKFQ